MKRVMENPKTEEIVKTLKEEKPFEVIYRFEGQTFTKKSEITKRLNAKKLEKEFQEFFKDVHEVQEILEFIFSCARELLSYIRLIRPLALTAPKKVKKLLE